MLRTLYVLPDNVDIDVTFNGPVSHVNHERSTNTYTFTATWVEDDKNYHASGIVPNINLVVEERLVPDVDTAVLVEMGKLPIIEIECTQISTYLSVLDLLVSGTENVVSPYIVDILRNDSDAVEHITIELHNNDPEIVDGFIDRLNARLRG